MAAVWYNKLDSRRDTKNRSEFLKCVIDMVKKEYPTPEFDLRNLPWWKRAQNPAGFVSSYNK